jgi:hypothetical protein
VKEAIALECNGFDVHLIFTQADEFETKLDQAILRLHPGWTYDALDWSGKDLRSKAFRIFYGLCRKVAEKLFFLLGVKNFAQLIVNRNYFWQVKKAVSAKADLYIAHNLGALAIAQRASKKCNAKFGFDAEDFHRHETADDPLDRDVIIKSTVENRNLFGIHHFTAASPLIAKAYKEVFPTLDPAVILNVFPRTAISIIKNEPNKNIRLFWFSQTLGENRGIETIVQAMGQTKQGFYELHLLGKPFPGYKEKIAELAAKNGLQHQLFFYDPVPEKEIFQLAAGCDIGMASETGVPFNRNICLTNKIFTYIQSGLAVVASDTSAQQQFIESHPFTGKIYQKNNVQSLAAILNSYAANRMELEACKQHNFQLGQTSMNWDVEQRKLVACIQKLFPVQKAPSSSFA